MDVDEPAERQSGTRRVLAFNVIDDPVDANDRLDFPRHYLSLAKPVPRIRTAQYGFIDAIAFSAMPLP